MSQTDPCSRLARELPPDGVRRILALRESMVSRGERGELARLVIDERGRLTIVVQETYAWRALRQAEQEG